MQSVPRRITLPHMATQRARMRVALVIERFEPRGGGMEAVAWQVAHGLAEAGDEVHVVARVATGSSAVVVHRADVRTGWQPLRVLAFSRAAARLAPRGGFDVVHAFSRTLHQDLYRAGGGCHADYLRQAHRPLARGLRRLTPRHATLLAVERRVFTDASQWIQCGSKLVRDQIARRYGVPAERLHVVYNGVDSQRFHPRPESDAGERDSRPIWLFAGSGWHRKGLDVALDALVSSRAKRAHLWVVGRDDPRAWQRRAARLGIADRVSFLGPRDAIESLYREVDALLLPTRYDAFANVCLEAAASGLPVVTSASNGSAEILADAAIVVRDPEDAGGFARALDRLADAGERRRLGARGREIACAFSWTAHVQALHALYEELPR